MDKNAKLVPTRSSLLDTLAHAALLRAVRLLSERVERILCIDATAGNGHDTCVLARFAGQVSAAVEVLACDVQNEALKKTEQRLAKEQLQAQLFLCGHEDMLRHVPQNAVLGACVFNLGYLPGKDRAAGILATKAETSIQALAAFCGRLVPQGCISVHCYTGHEGGFEEYAAVKEFAASLDPKLWRVLCIADSNRVRNSEYLFLLEKLQAKQRKSV